MQHSAPEGVDRPRSQRPSFDMATIQQVLILGARGRTKARQGRALELPPI